MELHINGEPVDLAPDTIFGITVQSNDITKPETVQSSYSNTVTLPFTEKNNRILGNANEVSSQSYLPYQKLDCAVLQDGVESMPAPKAYLKQAEEGYEVDVFSGSVNFFEQLGDKSIRDLDLSAFDHLWSSSNVQAGVNPNKTYLDGYIYDLLDRGKPLHLNNFYPGDLYPSVFVRAVYDQMMKEAGIKCLVGEPLFNKLLFPFANEKPVHSPAWLATRVYELGDVFDFGPPILQYGVLEFEFSFSTTEGGFTHFVTLREPGALTSASVNRAMGSVVVSGPGDYTIKGFFRVDKVLYNVADLIVSGNRDDGKVISNKSWKIRYQEETLFGSEWSIADNLPDIKQKDLFKMVNGLFNLMPSFDPYSNTMQLIPMQDLEKNKSKALDWSRKLVTVENKPVPVQYRFGDFGRNSWFRYKEGEDEGADGFLAIADEQLEVDKDVLQLPVAASGAAGNTLQVPLFKETVKQLSGFIREEADLAALSATTAPGGETVKVLDASGINTYSNIQKNQVYKGSALYGYVSPIWYFIESEYTYTTQKTPPRLTIHNHYGAQSIRLREAGVLDVNISIARAGFAPLAFPMLLKNYYGTLKSILEKCKGIRPYFMLSVKDVQNYDCSVPIWLDQYQSYFYLNSINEFTGEGPTECQLWRL